jgi:hypothetical protein
LAPCNLLCLASVAIEFLILPPSPLSIIYAG